MYRFKRILVHLQMNASDTQLMEYADHISQMANSEQITFLHTVASSDIPKTITDEYPELVESPGIFVRDKIREMVEKTFSGKDKPQIEIVVSEGSTLDEILKQVRLNGIDLVLTGINKEDDAATNLAQKLARKAPCSVLIVPDGAPFNLDHILVGTDFSEHAADALDNALAFARAGGAKELSTVHVYYVPTGYYKTGKSFEQFADIMKENARKQFSDFKSKFDTEPVKLNDHYLLLNKPAQAIKDFCSEANVTMLFLGTRGRGAGAAAMLGSVTEQLIEAHDIPILAVKKKGSGLNFLDAILQ